MLKIFIGYDSNEVTAYHTCVQSILDQAKKPVQIIALCKDQLSELYWRERNPKESTEFSMTRFLTPYLSGYNGISLFVDCDVIFLEDPYRLLAYPCSSPEKAVFVVKHDYTPKTETKFLGQDQTKYEKKNWSSVMLFNNRLCRKLSLTYINGASGLELHQFKWLENDELIGELPKEWNHLVGEMPENPSAKIVHFTLGTPCFNGYEEQEHSDAWHKIMKKSTSSVQHIAASVMAEIRNDPALSG